MKTRIALWWLVMGCGSPIIYDESLGIDGDTGEETDTDTDTDTDTCLLYTSDAADE